MSTVKKIGVLTGGGDAPGLNAVIRAVVKAAHNSGIAVIGLEDSFDGLIYPEKSRRLNLVKSGHRLVPLLGRRNLSLNSDPALLPADKQCW